MPQNNLAHLSCFRFSVFDDMTLIKNAIIPVKLAQESNFIAQCVVRSDDDAVTSLGNIVLHRRTLGRRANILNSLENFVRQKLFDFKSPVPNLYMRDLLKRGRVHANRRKI